MFGGGSIKGGLPGNIGGFPGSEIMGGCWMGTLMRLLLTPDEIGGTFIRGGGRKFGGGTLMFGGGIPKLGGGTDMLGGGIEIGGT